MSFFYDLNKRLANLGTEQKQISESVAEAQAEAKTPARVTLEESLKQDMKKLMEGAKPDFLDMDKDGDKKEPMKKAVGDKKKNPFAKKDEVDEGVAGPKSCWPGYKKTGTQPGTGKNAGKRVNDCEKIKEDGTGGAAQSNTLEDMDESALQAYLGKEKYGKAGMKALQQAGREGAGKEKMAKIRAQHDKLDELSPDTLKSYAKKAANSAANKGAELGQKMADADEVDRYTNRHFPKGTQQFAHRDAMRNAVGAGYDEINQSRGKAQKRVAGIGRAVDRLAREGEMEEGNEFSGELVKAKAMGKKEFEVDGKQYPVKEAGLPDIADKRAKMAQARGDKLGPVKASPLKNVGKGLKAFFKGEPEPMDEEAEMIEFLTRKAGPQGAAHPTDYNKSAGADAYNGMWGTGMDQDLDEEMTLEASVSRKHFQQVADLLRNIPDEAKRKEMAMHHAVIFKQQNPRFDIARFGQAAGVDLAECSMYEELKGGQHKLDVDGDGDIGADDLADLRAGKEVDEGFGEMDAWLKSREKEKGTGKFDKRKVSTGTVYTRKFDDEAEDDTDAPASKGGAPRGRGRPAVAKKPERVTGGSYKYKAGRNNPKEMNEAGSCPHCGGSLDKDGELDEQKVEAGKRHFFDKLAPAAKKAAKVVNALKGSKKPVDEESTGKEDSKAEKAGKKVAKDIEHDEGNKSKDDDKAEKAGKRVTKDIESDDKKDKKEKKSGNPFAKKDKEEQVDETTTSGSVATVAAGGKKSSGAGAVGKGIYDSWERDFNTLLSESVNVSTEASMMEDGNEEESITITATGDDVARLRDVLTQLGVVQSSPSHDHDHDEPYANSEQCGTCGGVPCQCDELDADMGLPGVIELEIDEEYGDNVVDQNSPDYPTNQETSDDALQYSGGLNKPKSTGQTTVPVIANQGRQTSMESKDSVDSFLNLYKAFAKTK